MNIEDFACGVLMEAMPSIPADVLDVVEDDISAGEYFTSLVEVIERAPHVVSERVVNALADHLLAMPQGAHREVGLAAIARYRRLLTA